EMKKEYVTPRMVGERFLPNEYVAACGDSGTVYKFECNAGGGTRGDVFTKDGRNLTEDSWMVTNYYHACGTTHEAESNDDFIEGYFFANGGNDKTQGYKAIPVIIWTDGGTDVHCTTNLDMSTWETAKS
ncbi:MAG: hypothetical protein Q4C52_05350, partial [Eubacteriales bacterium]|nr:hypothetical protein [Eubacteriales bacterium]